MGKTTLRKITVDAVDGNYFSGIEVTYNGGYNTQRVFYRIEDLLSLTENECPTYLDIKDIKHKSAIAGMISQRNIDNEGEDNFAMSRSRVTDDNGKVKSRFKNDYKLEYSESAAD